MYRPQKTADAVPSPLPRQYSGGSPLFCSVVYKLRPTPLELPAIQRHCKLSNASATTDLHKIYKNLPLPSLRTVKSVVEYIQAQKKTKFTEVG